MIKVSVLINTLNEEKNIRNCLESVKWADEIIIVDMYSDDKTVQIAKEYTNKIFFHQRLKYADPARQFALDKASNEWILVVDADELVPVNFKEKLLEIAESNKYDAVLTPHHNYLFGEEMKGTGWGPLQDTHIRFFRKNVMTYSSRVHNFANLNSNARVFKLEEENNGFIHFNFLNFEHYIEKFNRYTTIEAENDYSDKKKPSIFRASLKGLQEFFIRFFKSKGYRDGIQGFVLSLMMFLYRIVAEFKLVLIYKYGLKNEKNILEKYNKVVEREMNKYDLLQK